LKKVFDRYISL